MMVMESRGHIAAELLHVLGPKLAPFGVQLHDARVSHMQLPESFVALSSFCQVCCDCLLPPGACPCLHSQASPVSHAA